MPISFPKNLFHFQIVLYLESTIFLLSFIVYSLNGLIYFPSSFWICFKSSFLPYFSSYIFCSYYSSLIPRSYSIFSQLKLYDIFLSLWAGSLYDFFFVILNFLAFFLSLRYYLISCSIFFLNPARSPLMFPRLEAIRLFSYFISYYFFFLFCQ